MVSLKQIRENNPASSAKCWTTPPSDGTINNRCARPPRPQRRDWRRQPRPGLPVPFISEGARRAVYELSEVAEKYLPAKLRDPERWLRRRLNARVFPGTRVGRHWVMTEAQVQTMLRTLGTENEVAPEPEPAEPEAPNSFLESLSPRSRNRLRAVE